MVRVFVLVLLMTAQAQAGAWPRGKGKVFYSVSTEIAYPATTDPASYMALDIYSTFYGEYGLTDQLTFGVDLGGSGMRMSKGVAFLRWPLGHADRQTKLAVEFGLGMVGSRNAVRPGFSLGRGMQLGKHHGWLALDNRWVLFEQGDSLWESDLTAGLNLGKKFKGIVQFQFGLPQGQSGYAAFAPSLVYETKPGYSFELGLNAGLVEKKSRAIKLGMWRQF